SPEVNSLIGRLSATGLVAQPALLKSLLANAAGKKGTRLRPNMVLEKLAPASDPELGAGLTKLEKKDTELGRTLKTDRVAETGVLVEVDRIARAVPGDQLADVAAELKKAAKKNATLVAKVADLKTRFPTP